MFIDKFYRIYSPYDTKTTQGRSSSDNIKHSLNFNSNDNYWDALDYSISNLKSGKNSSDAAIMGQVLTRKDDKFVQGNDKYEFLEVNSSNNWNAKKRKISNLEPASSENEAATLGQTLRRTDDGFVQGDKKYNFLEVSNNIWDAKRRKISNLEPATSGDNAVTLSQTLMRKDDGFVQGENKYEFLEVNSDKWNAKSRKISNLQAATDKNEAATLGQTLTRKDDKFVLGDDKYEFLEVSSNNIWDGKSRKISNLESGISSNDAVTVSQTLTRKDNNSFAQGNSTYTFMELENNSWNGRNHIIKNLEAGVNEKDSVTVSQIPRETEDSWDFKGKKIINIGRGIGPTDSVIKEQTITLDPESKHFNGGNRRIANVELGIEAHDCVIRGQVISLNEKVNNQFYAGHKQIKRVAAGSNENDVATLSQIPKETEDSWDFKGKKIINIGQGIGPTDSVTMEQTITLDPESKHFDCGKRRIANIELGKDSYDCVTKGQVIALEEKVNNQFYAGNKQIKYVRAGSDEFDVAIVSQLLRKVDGKLLLAGEELNVLQLNNDNVWDCKNLKITGVQPGVNDNDICVMKQLKELKDIFPKLLVADPEFGLKTLDGEVYKPKGFVYHNDKGNVTNSEGRRITCPGFKGREIAYFD